MAKSPRQQSFFGSLLILAPIFALVLYYSVKTHYELPEPLTELFNPQTGEPQLSEAAILSFAQHLSEEIGFRTVGTREHALGDEWAYRQVLDLKKVCDEAAAASPGRKLECEVWRQQGSGHHRFDILNTRLYKTYVNLTNIILRISDGTEEGKEHAVLLNAHLDSTLPSPGAADDALPGGVMLEVARNLVLTKTWEPSFSVIFLWNNAEESLQDGSHLYSTQHETAPTVRAAINLEAAGVTGPEILFQATSEEMINAYAHVPRPYGTIVANDVFSSGIIMSDTDFRQFELYLNVTGLDMAIVGHSYFYHTRKDLVKYVEPGASQHMAENALALVKYLTSPESPLPSLTTGYKPPSTVFFSLFGSLFFQYNFATANTLHAITFISTIILYFSSEPSIPFLEQIKGIGLMSAGLVGSVVSVNLVAFVMTKVLNSGLSWFAHEQACLWLYGPAALAGALATQQWCTEVKEHTLVMAILLMHSTLACVVQFLGVGSAGVFFLSSIFIFTALLADQFMRGKKDPLWLGVYAIGQLSTLSLGSEMFCAVLDMFVPLSGRMGKEAPAEHIIATIVPMISSYAVPLILPFCHRFGKKFISRAFVISSLVTLVTMAVFTQRAVFDPMHPKRLFIMHLENVTSHEVSINFAAADSAPGFSKLVNDVAKYLHGSEAQAESVHMNPYNGEWDVVYPFSTVLDPYKIRLEHELSAWSSQKDLFRIEALNDWVDPAAKTRSLTISVTHPGLIWTVIAFDAKVIKWSLDDNPPERKARHHVREASFYGIDAWTMDLTVDISEESDPGLTVNFIGMREQAMWPGKVNEKALGGEPMKIFEHLDGWLEQHTGDSVDAALFACVGGITVI